MAQAIHGQSESAHVVGIGNLRVMITNDDGSWFAQSLEIDYAAQGHSLEDVKKRFEDGLCKTIEQHLRIYGSIDNLLQVAPKEVWTEFFNNSKIQNRYSHVSVHEKFPFDGIEYFERAA